MAALDKQLHASILNIKNVVDLILTESLYPAGYSSRHPVSMYTHMHTYTISCNQSGPYCFGKACHIFTALQFGGEPLPPHCLYSLQS